MSLHEEDPAIVAQFMAAVNEISGIHTMSVMAIRFLPDKLLPLLSHGDPGQDFLVGRTDPDDPDAFAYQSWKIGDIPGKLAEEGPIVRALGQQWVVMVGTQWEDEFRPRLAEARGVEAAEVADPVMGDIFKMRNDIVHHRGIAKNSERCEVLRWFSAGQEMMIDGGHISEFVRHLHEVAR